MRRFGCAAFAAVAVIGFASVASAADLPVKAPVAAPPPVVLYSWTGFYVGANAGWVGSTGNTITNTGTDTGGGGIGNAIAIGAIPTSLSLSYSGFIGGGQIGYNWQAGNWVYGVEADFEGASAKNNTTIAPISVLGNSPQGSAFSRELDWLATFRGRIGVTATPAFLLYATGGLAVGQTKIGNSYICPTCGPPSFTEASTVNTNSTTAAGWTVGAGAEWMFAPHWSLKAEYLYVDLGSHSSTVTYTYGATSTMTSTVRDAENIVRGGINYHF